MKIVLLETLDNLGMVGDVVNVRPGYARNFLLPRSKALAANSRNVKDVEHQKLVLEHKVKRARQAAEEVRKTLHETGVLIKRKAGENDKLFGSVTSMDIEESLRSKGIALSRRFILLSDPIKKVGKYEIPVKLDGGLQATLKVEVSAE